ncbi:MAG: hypothetical protein FJY86_02175 [Candidatus Diapherotrites archaeon]|uniref:Uncharacterized protein n=1 Tax=Candidatus Iainarchaeum sp. TaxID=3101447 RepID=A0A8T4C6H8_9ARCH|nr:hypothetical protein [Candidatus Diapherotrites archaeon]
MRVLVPILSPADANDVFVQHISENASVVYLLLVLDPKSASASFGFKTSEIMAGRETIDKMKLKIKENKRLCTDILEWGNTLEKIVQIAEMKQVEKILLHNGKSNAYFQHVVADIQKQTSIPVEAITKI